MGRNDYTGLLYSSPSFLAGMARAVDIGGTFDEYNTSDSDFEADEIAMASDWYAVGADLYQAIHHFQEQLKGHPVRGGRHPSR